MTVKIHFNKSVLIVTGLITGLFLMTTSAFAAPELTVIQPINGSTTVVEQYSDGDVATITATPNGISMRNGAPFSVAQVTTIPRYSLNQGASTVVTRGPVTSQVTQQIGNTLITIPTVITPTVTTPTVMTPVTTSTQVLVPMTTTVPAMSSQLSNTQVVNGQIVNDQAVTTVTLDTLKLTPTFSTPDIVSANTKVMKILKDSNGRDVAVPANKINPGDIIEYHTTYMNNTAQPVTNLDAMVSLPNGVRLVSLNSSIPTFATTGGGNYQTIQQMGNSVVVQENYSGLKWNLANLASSTPQTVIIRAKVQ